MEDILTCVVSLSGTISACTLFVAEMLCSIYDKFKALLKFNDVVTIDKVSESKREGTKIMQMSLAGPTHWTNVILNEIKQEGLEENNAKVFWENELIGWEMMSTWKRELHTPSSKNPFKKINQHWLKDY